MVTLMTETLGQTIRRLRETKGISQRKLAELAGKDLSYINRLENDRAGGITLKTASELAQVLGATAETFLGSEINSHPTDKSFVTMLDELKEKYTALDLLELPLRGTVPAGMPFPQDEESGEFIEVPRQELQGLAVQGLYAVKISGNSLQGDEIYSGDAVVVNTGDKVIQDGKIYIVRLGNEVCARHVFKKNDHLRLVSSNGEYKELLATEAEILGKVVLSGRWKKH